MPTEAEVDTAKRRIEEGIAKLQRDNAALLEALRGLHAEAAAWLDTTSVEVSEYDWTPLANAAYKAYAAIQQATNG